MFMNVGWRAGGMPAGALGLSLVEVLVTTAVLAFGLLGLAALLARSTSLAWESYARTISTERIYSFADRIRLNPAGVAAGDYDDLEGSVAAACGVCTTGCNPAEIAALDYCEWSKELAASLASGTGSVKRSDDAFDITVNWLNPRLPAGQQEQSYSLRVRP